MRGAPKWRGAGKSRHSPMLAVAGLLLRTSQYLKPSSPKKKRKRTRQGKKDAVQAAAALSGAGCSSSNACTSTQLISSVCVTSGLLLGNQSADMQAHRPQDTTRHMSSAVLQSLHAHHQHHRPTTDNTVCPGLQASASHSRAEA